MFWPTTCSADDSLYSKNNTSCIWSGQERLDLDSYSHHLIPAPLVEQQPSLNLSFILISPTHLILFHLILLCWHKSVHRQTPGKTLEAAKKGATICFDDTRTDRWKQYQLVKSSLHDHFCVKSFNCNIDIGPKWTFLSPIWWGLVLCTQKNTVRLHEKLFELQERLHVQCNQVENNVCWHIAYQEKSSHVCPKEEDKSDHSATLNSHPCSWWWSPRPCRRRARLDLSGRWRSGRGWWRRAWRGCCLRRSAPGYESWPHRRRWWSTCRCRWCSAWGQREEQSQRERENQQLRTSRDDSEQVVSTADCVGDAVTSEAKCCVRPQAEVFNSLQTQRGFHRPRDVCFTTNAPASQTRSEQKKVQDIEISVNVMWHKSSEWLRNVIGLEGV